MGVMVVFKKRSPKPRSRNRAMRRLLDVAFALR